MEKNQTLLPELLPAKGIHCPDKAGKEKTNKKLIINFVLKFGDPNHPKTDYSVSMLDAAGIPVLDVKERSRISGGWDLQVGLADIWGLEDAAPSFLGEPEAQIKKKFLIPKDFWPSNPNCASVVSLEWVYSLLIHVFIPPTVPSRDPGQAGEEVGW